MRKTIWFDLERSEAYLPWRVYHFSARQIAGFTVAIVVIIIISAFVDGRAIGPYLTAALYTAVLLPFGLKLSSYLLSPNPVGVSPEAMVASGWWRPRRINWSEVRALVHTHTMLGSMAPIDRNLIVIMKDNRKTRVFLPVLSNEEMSYLVTILRDIAGRHGFEFVLDHTDEGQKRARELGAI
ncbi:hypothetical protein HPQ64_08890 [Rhizobiales bacterium]|uniref:hypothetical protein n=1 Tax=Hongsoonwoonella zoysiae TaxID=2821844 RepID=UPI0015604747|nr:hypothetical protein [Hongsoonwoonella zoysiae]NRG17804.1 hypothetical protein [Hongsoonwoonella zoysiae]